MHTFAKQPNGPQAATPSAAHTPQPATPEPKHPENHAEGVEAEPTASRLAYDYGRIPLFSGMRVAPQDEEDGRAVSILPPISSAAPSSLVLARRVDTTHAVPGEAAGGVLNSPGVPLESGAAHQLTPRFDFDLGSIRIHADSSAAGSAQALGAKAYTWGHHLVFGPGAYQPGSPRGLSLLAHELTHVGQQLGGSEASEEAQERQADAVEAGGSFVSSVVSPRAGSPRPALRLRPGDATSLTIIAAPNGSASFSAQTEAGRTVTASGSVTELQPGEYRVRSSGGSMVISTATGTVVPRTTRFDIPWSQANAALIRALAGATSAIPMHVQGGTVPAATGGGEAAAPSEDELMQRQLDALPERIRNFLFTPGGATVRPEDRPALLRIAERIANLSDAELAEFRARTVGGTASVLEFEQSVNRWLTELRARRGGERELDEASMALFGLDEIYEMYRGWQRGLLMGGPPSWIAEWERLPTSALPLDREGTMNQLYLRMRRSLARFGYANLAAFSTAIARFLTAFRENAYHIGRDLLDRYEHVLVEQAARPQAGAAELYAALAPARATFRAADEYQAAAQAQYGGWSPDEVLAYHAAGPEYQRQVAQGRSQVLAQASIQPLITNQDFPVEEIGRARDQAAVARVLNNYITSRQTNVRDTRDRISQDHELIYKLTVLVAHAKARQGIQPQSIWSKIIEDHQAPTVDQIMLDTMLLTLAVAAGIMSGGSAFFAVASLGLSSYLALQQYEDYAIRSDAYGAQLLAEEPSLAWVILAVVGVVLDFAVVARVIRPIRPALQQFQRTGNITELEAQLGGVEERIRRSILQRAELEVQARRGWEGIVPPGALRGSLFGLDMVAELLGKVVYSIQINLRRGINTFNRWVLTREAIDLIGDINRLQPEELQRVAALYRQAVADGERIAVHGRSLGMTAEEVDTVVQNWARRGSGTADDIISEMSAARRSRAAAEAASPAEIPWTPPRGWNGPSRHGRWLGVRGNSGWIDDRPEVIRIVGRSAAGEANPVPFREGVVDFSQWSQGEIRVAGLTGEHAHDMPLIRQAIANERNLLPGGSRSAREAAALDWLRTAPDGHGGTGLRPHHAGGESVQLVPRDVHKVQHTDLSVY